MATSFSGGRRRSTWRQPPTMGKELVNFITCGCKKKISLEQGNKLSPSTPVKNKISLEQGNKFLQNL